MARKSSAPAKSEFMLSLEALCKDKGIERDVLVDAIEQALIIAYKRNYNSASNVKVAMDDVTGDIHVYALRTVVDEITDPTMEVSLEEARKVRAFYEAGDVMEVEVTPRNFGRIAAQTAKQVFNQKIRDAERGRVYEEYIEKENEILTAIVQRVEGKNVFLDLGRTEGLLEPAQQIPGEEYQVNDRIKVYVLEVNRTARGPQVLVSRIHAGLVKRLFELEVPEIQSGVVQIKSIAREAGYRTKMAVYSTDSTVDPVGACVGQRGLRVEKIVNELRDEKVDVIKWSSDPVELIGNALSPAKVIGVFVNNVEKAAKVIVQDSQLSLAIGKEGQNARLAAKLTGWKIDIKSQSQIEEVLGV
ncbi:MAG: transcription termination/antitermination protein NusA [Clostridia bacterium]|nr:transcription termination/antitermination protein NusA [Clostridia bacterium]